MNILVFSDTHGHGRGMVDIVNREKDSLDACFFLGDGFVDAEYLQQQFPKLPVYAVPGNCDMAAGTALEGLAPFGGLLIFYTHGHRYHVKSGLDELLFAAKEKGADVALFGHTHTAFYQKQENVHLFNPGSLVMPRYGAPSYGLITIKNGKPDFYIQEYDRKKQ